MHRLEYIPANATIPRGRVSSTARRGQKWNNLVAVGDVVLLAGAFNGDVFGKAAVVAKELVSYEVVLENADHNHSSFNPANAGVPKDLALKAELEAAYGANIPATEMFTVLHILPLNTEGDAA